MGASKGITQAIAAIASEAAKTISGVLIIETCLPVTVLAWPFLPMICDRTGIPGLPRPVMIFCKSMSIRRGPVRRLE
jgi:hypothetical protein